VKLREAAINPRHFLSYQSVKVPGQEEELLMRRLSGKQSRRDFAVYLDRSAQEKQGKRGKIRLA
jgi:hypothetical protein